MSWGALFCGVVIAFTFQLLFSLLGATIGFGSVGENGASSNASTLSLATGLWWVVSSCVALFAGGFVAAWLAGSKTRLGGVLHGIVAWGVVTLLMVYLISTAVGSLLGGGLSALGGVTTSVGSGAKEAAAPAVGSLGLSPDMIKQQVDDYLQPAPSDPAAMNPQDARKETAKALATYEQGGDGSARAKERIIAIMAAQLKISQAEAARKFDAAQQKIDDAAATAKSKATAAADAASSAAAKATLALAIDLLLGAIAGALGGALAIGGTRRSSQATIAA